MISDNNIEVVDRQPLDKQYLAQELEKAQAINNEPFIKQKWLELVEWLETELGKDEAIIFINDTFTYNDFLCEIRLAI